MKKRFLFVWLAVCVMLAIFPGMVQAAGSHDSGRNDMSKLGRGEIIRILDENPLTLPENMFVTEPSYRNPYSAGIVNPAALQAAADRLNALRRIAGLGSVALDSDLNENAQYGAVLLSSSDFGHYPSRPADMDESFYQKGLDATSSSNIAGGTTLTASVDAFMDDSDPSNVAALGHRRWQLNPSMGKVGFGYACNLNAMFRHYVVEKVFDYSAGSCDYDFISWPASGNFPDELFNAGTAWSVTLNPQKYQTNDLDNITVILTRKSDGTQWVFSDGNLSDGGYFNVDHGGYGVANCIVFRPDIEAGYNGTYLVRIDGLKYADGTAADFSYEVKFFTPVIDVSAKDWFYNAVLYAFDKELMNGISNELFAPDLTTSRAMIVTILYRLEDQPVVGESRPFNDVSDGQWYTNAILWAEKNNIVNGYGNGKFGPNDNITREQLAAILYHYSIYKGHDVSVRGDISAFTDSSLVDSWADVPMAWAVGAGVLNGKGNGILDPLGNAKRSEAAQMLMNYIEQ